MKENYDSQVLTKQRHRGGLGLGSISSEIVTDVTNSPNFYVGRCADVGGKGISIFCIQ